MDENAQNDDQPKAVATMRTMEIIVALLLLGLGALVAWDSNRLGSKWGDDGPESGYFPFYIGMIIVVSSAITLWQAFRMDREDAEASFVNRTEIRQVMAVLLPAVVYVIGIQLIGIYVASAVYIAVFMIWLGKYSAWKGVLLGIAVSAAMYMMFEVWFKVPLHKGNWIDPLSLLGL